MTRHVRQVAILALVPLVALAAGCHRHPAAAAGANLAPDFTMKDMNGKDVHLADLRGKPVIVNFWATWCDPCKLEIPDLVALQDRYRAQGLTILGVSIDDNPSDLRKFASQYKMNYPVLVGDGHEDIQDKYGLGIGIPVTVFIKADGTIASRQEGTLAIYTKEWLDQHVEALF